MRSTMQIFTAAQINSTPSLKNYLFLVPTKERRIENAYTCNLYSLKLLTNDTTRIELLSIDPNRWNDDRNEIFRSTRINILRGDWGQNGTKALNFLDINSFENYYVPRKNRFFAGRNVRVQLWYDTISVTREEKRKDIPHFR